MRRGGALGSAQPSGAVLWAVVLEAVDSGMRDTGLCWPTPVAVVPAAEGQRATCKAVPRDFSAGNQFSPTPRKLGTNVGAQKAWDSLHFLNVGVYLRCL